MGHRQDDHQMETLNKYFFFVKEKSSFLLSLLWHPGSVTEFCRGVVSPEDKERKLLQPVLGVETDVILEFK